MFVIRKDIPAPVNGPRAYKSELARTLCDCAVGDSFFVPASISKTGNLRGLKTTVYANRKRWVPEVKLAVREVTENGAEGIRVWRVK